MYVINGTKFPVHTYTLHGTPYHYIRMSWMVPSTIACICFEQEQILFYLIWYLLGYNLGLKSRRGYMIISDLQ